MKLLEQLGDRAAILEETRTIHPDGTITIRRRIELCAAEPETRAVPPSVIGGQRLCSECHHYTAVRYDTRCSYCLAGGYGNSTAPVYDPKTGYYRSIKLCRGG